MPTNDGYHPYSVGLSAAVASAAIQRAAALSTELLGYVAYSDSTVPPTLAQGAKEGDIWHDIQFGIYYRVYVNTVTNPATGALTSTILYFEV